MQFNTFRQICLPVLNKRILGRNDGIAHGQMIQCPARSNGLLRQENLLPLFSYDDQENNNFSVQSSEAVT
jgi:hypothetical protein